MKPTQRPLSDPAPADQDLADQAQPGHGIPSQDLNPAAQSGLEPHEARREAQSVLAGGGLIAGAAAGVAIGSVVAGPVGAVVGGTVGAVTGALGGAAAGTVASPDSLQAGGAATSVALPEAPERVGDRRSRPSR